MLDRFSGGGAKPVSSKRLSRGLVTEFGSKDLLCWFRRYGGVLISNGIEGWNWESMKVVSCICIMGEGAAALKKVSRMDISPSASGLWLEEASEGEGLPAS